MLKFANLVEIENGMIMLQNEDLLAKSASTQPRTNSDISLILGTLRQTCENVLQFWRRPWYPTSPTRPLHYRVRSRLWPTSQMQIREHATSWTWRKVRRKLLPNAMNLQTMTCALKTHAEGVLLCHLRRRRIAINPENFVVAARECPIPAIWAVLSERRAG